MSRLSTFPFGTTRPHPLWRGSVIGAVSLLFLLSGCATSLLERPPAAAAVSQERVDDDTVMRLPGGLVLQKIPGIARGELEAMAADPQRDEKLAALKRDRVEKLKKKALAGDDIAQAHYAGHLAIGDGVPADMTEAMKWYRASAAQGNKNAELGLAERDIFGDYPPDAKPNYEKAYPVVEAAAKRSSGRGMYWYYVYHDQGLGGVTKNPGAAQGALARSADLGFGPAKVLLLASIGRVEESYYLLAQNLAWFTHEAEHGFPKSATVLGAFYQKEGPYRDLAKAKSWYEKAGSEPLALQRLGNFYLGGVPAIGLAPDAKKAYALYQQAAEQGYVPAKTSITMMEAMGQAGKKPSTAALERRLKEVCEAGDVAGCELLGHIFAEGRWGYPKDAQKARHYWEVACSRGSVEACHAIQATKG